MQVWVVTQAGACPKMCGERARCGGDRDSSSVQHGICRGGDSFVFSARAVLKSSIERIETDHVH